MKKVFKSILLLIALCLPLLGQRVSADVTEEPLQVVVQHQFENPDGSELVYGADIALSLYDISKQYQAKKRQLMRRNSSKVSLSCQHNS